MLWPFPAIPNNPMGRAVAALAITLATTATAAAAQAFDCVIDPSETVKIGSPITGVLAEVLVNAATSSPVESRSPAGVQHRGLDGTAQSLCAESTAKIDAQKERLKLARSRVERTGNVRGFVVTQDKFEELHAEAGIAEQDLLREQQDRQLSQLELETIAGHAGSAHHPQHHRRDRHRKETVGR